MLKVTMWPNDIKYPFHILKHKTHRVVDEMSMATTQLSSHNAARARVQHVVDVVDTD